MSIGSLAAIRSVAVKPIISTQRRPGFHSQQCDLLGDESQHENNNRCGEHENRHIREPALGYVSVNVVCEAREEEKYAYR